MLPCPCAGIGFPSYSSGRGAKTGSQLFLGVGAPQPHTLTPKPFARRPVMAADAARHSMRPWPCSGICRDDQITSSKQTRIRSQASCGSGRRTAQHAAHAAVHAYSGGWGGAKPQFLEIISNKKTRGALQASRGSGCSPAQHANHLARTTSCATALN